MPSSVLIVPDIHPQPPVDKIWRAKMRQTLMTAALLAAFAAPAGAFDTAECGEIEGQIYTMLDAEFGWEVTQSPTSTSEARPGACSVTDL